MDYMEKAWDTSKKIAAFYSEQKYTDKEGRVWLGIEDDGHHKDYWIRQDAMVSIPSADMMKKMMYELNGWDETPVEDPYEYAAQIITGPRAGKISGDFWADKEDRQGFVTEMFQFSGRYDYKLVKRRKAGPVQDA